MKIIHITDTHLTDPGERLFDDDPAQRLADCIDDINRLHRDACLCLFTGDLVHNGTPASYARLRQELDRLIVPYRLVLGNHDRRDAFKNAFPEAGVDSNGFIQSYLDIGDSRFVLIDTLQEGVHSGTLCAARLAWLKETLLASRGKRTFLAMHHPPMRIHHRALDKLGLAQAGEFAGLVRSMPHVRHVFFGHVHRSISGAWEGVSFNAVGGTNGLSWVDFAENEVTVCRLPPPVYATVHVSDSDIVVHMNFPRDTSPKFRYDPYGATGVEFERLS
jgi:3',5'-cyclic AMP phosphodiesterase CpdA